MSLLVKFRAELAGISTKDLTGKKFSREQPDEIKLFGRRA